jgi:hypothetical protein
VLRAPCSVLRATGKGLLALSVGLATCLTIMGTAFAGTLPTTNSSGQPIDPRAFSTCAQLPPQVDLRGLTDTQLITYGLPTHAVLDADLAQWERVLASHPQRVCARPTPLGFRVSRPPQPAATNSPPCNPPQAGDYCATANWDGEETLGARGTYRVSNTYVYVPHVTGSVNDTAAFWTGVGGEPKVAGAVVLVQDGIATTVTSNGQYNESWVDVEPNNNGAYNLPLCRLRTGDEVYLYEESNSANDGYDYFYILNVTANCNHSCYVHTNNQQIQDTCGFSGGPSFNSDSATGEAIAEKQDGVNLADWNSNNTVTIGPCRVNGQYLGTFPYFSRYIWDGTYDVADLGGLMSNTIFDVYWWRPY